MFPIFYGDLVAVKPKIYRYQLADGAKPSDVAACLGTVGALEKPSAKSLTFRYFDTFDWRLFGAGQSLSVGPGERGLEIRFAGSEGDGAAVVLPGDLATGFANDVPEGPVRDALKGLIDVRRLLPCLDIVTTRSRYVVRNGEGKIVLRVRLDDARARKPRGRTAKVLGTFLTIEPVRGYAKAEAKARKRLADKIVMTPATEPLRIAGFRAAGVKAGDYSSKLKLTLKPEQSAGDPPT